MSLISRDRSIVPACDFPLEVFERLVKETGDLPGVGAYKIGAALGLSSGLERVVSVARSHTDKPLIYDHQKAATDIPETADFFMATLANAGIAGVILFPLSGPATQTAWTTSAIEHGLDVIVGGRMTHSSFAHADGGYIADGSSELIYDQAATQGVRSFVVPGNQTDFIRATRERVSVHCEGPVFYAPGFVEQGGSITEAAKAAGPRWHAIVGRAIYNAPSMRAAAEEHCAAL